MLGNLIGEGLISIPTKTIKVNARTWDTLKSLKKENETFDDVIKGLLNERTTSIGNENVKAIKYQRKTDFFRRTYMNRHVGFEFEYNDVKDNKFDFTLDLKIKKVFFGKKIFNPSEFFGVDNDHKHFSYLFLVVYLKLITLVFLKEFRISFTISVADCENIVKWRQLYYDYNLSEDSFQNDIEEPLRLSEEEKPSQEWIGNMEQSVINKLGGEPSWFM